MGATTLQPGESTTLSFSTMMHRGMEGPHHFAISLPVTSADGQTEPMAMHVLGDFR